MTSQYAGHAEDKVISVLYTVRNILISKKKMEGLRESNVNVLDVKSRSAISTYFCKSMLSTYQ